MRGVYGDRLVAAQQRVGFGFAGYRRRRAAQWQVGGFVDEQHGDQADHRRAHQVVRRHQRVAGALHKPGGDQRRGATEQRHRHVERDRQRAVAHRGVEQRRQRGRHGTGETHQRQPEQHQAEEDQPVVAAAHQQQARNGQREQRDARADDHRPTAQAVTEQPAHHVERHHHQHHDDDQQQALALCIAHGHAQVAGHVGEQHVVGDVEHQHQAHALEQLRPMHAQQRAQPGAFKVAFVGLFGIGAERRGLFQLHPHVQAEQAQRAGDQERQAPAPVQHLRAAQGHVQHGHRGRTGDVATQRAELEPAAHQAAVAVGGIFGDERGRAAVFAAGGEPLHQARKQQQGRGPHADAVVGRNQADAEGAQRHQDHGEGQHFLAAVSVTQRAEHQPTQRADQERHGERGEGGDQLRGRAAGGEEHLAERDRKIAIHTEIEPFHRIAERGGTHGFLEHGAIDHGDFVDLHLAAALEPPEMGMCGMQFLHLLSPGSRVINAPEVPRKAQVNTASGRTRHEARRGVTTGVPGRPRGTPRRCRKDDRETGNGPRQ